MVALLEAYEVAERIRAASEEQHSTAGPEHVIQENERLGDDSLSDPLVLYWYKGRSR